MTAKNGESARQNRGAPSDRQAPSEKSSSTTPARGPSSRLESLAKKLNASSGQGDGEDTEAVGMSSGSGSGKKLDERIIAIIRKMWGINATYSQISELTGCDDTTISKYTKGFEQGFALKKDDGRTL